MHETIRASVPNKISCEIHNDEKLLMQSTSSVVHREHQSFDKTVTKITNMQNKMNGDVLVQFGHVPSPIDATIVCKDSATSLAMFASVVVLLGSFYLQSYCKL